MLRLVRRVQMQLILGVFPGSPLGWPCCWGDIEGLCMQRGHTKTHVAMASSQQLTTPSCPGPGETRSQTSRRGSYNGGHCWAPCGVVSSLPMAILRCSHHIQPLELPLVPPTVNLALVFSMKPWQCAIDCHNEASQEEKVAQNPLY